MLTINCVWLAHYSAFIADSQNRQQQNEMEKVFPPKNIVCMKANTQTHWNIEANKRERDKVKQPWMANAFSMALDIVHCFHVNMCFVHLMDFIDKHAHLNCRKSKCLNQASHDFFSLANYTKVENSSKWCGSKSTSLTRTSVPPNTQIFCMSACDFFHASRQLTIMENLWPFVLLANLPTIQRLCTKSNEKENNKWQILWWSCRLTIMMIIPLFFVYILFRLGWKVLTWCRSRSS